MALIYFHQDFLLDYASDPAASPGRLEPAVQRLKDSYPFAIPSPGTPEEVLRVHDRDHLERISREGETLYHTALLALGAVREASLTAMEGEHAFALCRPPGHHAGISSYWGFCYFNNVAAAVAGLLESGAAKSAVIVDFDLHFGDGTKEIFSGEPAVTYWHGRTRSSPEFIEELRNFLKEVSADVLAVSAGFDRHRRDWGGMLDTGDYREIGRVLGNFAAEKCGSRVFSALEGGYNPRSLAESIEAFLEGLEEGMEK